MIDSIKKDTVCVVQELVVLFQKNKELMATANEICTSAIEPSNGSK
jgi:hypothetical protein